MPAAVQRAHRVCGGRRAAPCCAPAMQHLGEAAAIATAISWTGSSLVFALATRRAAGLATNQFRLLAALPCLWLLHAGLEGAWWPALPGARGLQLAASGVIGLVL